MSAWGRDYFFFTFWYFINLTTVCAVTFLHMDAAVGDSMENSDYTESFLSLCRFLEVFSSLEVRTVWWFSGVCKANSL